VLVLLLVLLVLVLLLLLERVRRRLHRQNRSALAPHEQGTRPPWLARLH
jgi:ABC-type Fe3+ transport system permease subunit